MSLPDALHTYLLAVSLREPAILGRLREETDGMPDARMQLSPEAGQFLAFLVRLLGARRTIEIGTFTGYSALWVALALPEDGTIVACDINEETTAVARRYWAEAGVDGKIDLRLGPALHTLDDLLADGQAGSFDLAFIDADKERYEDYYERALQLVRPGGLIAIDNTLWGGRVADATVQDPRTDALRTLNERLHHDDRIALALLPLGDGLTLALRQS